ncbi:MAG: pyridoxamine 5'-phosphate oxidase family protein [Acidimicrobiales bacterium]
MRETSEELHELQRLLDASLAGSSEHLQSIVAEQTMNADELTQTLTGMCVLGLATVTASGEPRISGVDGHFLHGAWHFGTALTAVKAHHLAARPTASASHIRGDELGVFTHGTVVTMNPAGGAADPGWPELRTYLQDHYGDHEFDWDHEVVYFRLRPHWMTVYRGDPGEPDATPKSET